VVQRIWVFEEGNMLNLYFQGVRGLGLLMAVLLLVACSGQPPIPEDVVVGEPAATTDKNELKVDADVDDVPAEPVELLPARKAADATVISMEPLLAETTASARADVEAVPETATLAAGKSATPVASVTAKVETGSNHFIVTVGPKAPSHPAYGKGHMMGFLVDGESGKDLVLERGKTYLFDIRTDPKHDVYLSKKEIGWGSTPLAEGVKGAYTYKGQMTFMPGKDTPDAVFYACRNHPYMGGMLHVVDPGEKPVLTKRSETVGKAEMVARPAVSKATQATVKQKLMFAEMMVNAQGAKRVQASQNAEAKQLLQAAKDSLSQGKEKLQVGSLDEALALADQALKTMSKAVEMVPSGEALAQQQESYTSLLAGIEDYQKSHKANLARLEKAGSMPVEARYDEKKVARLKSDAQALADKGDYAGANAKLHDVQKIVTTSLHKMLDSTTIVYDLNFATAVDEYEYELKRFAGYEELIPVAIEAKKPAPGAIKLMESFLEKARKRRDEAKAKAAADDYGTAIAMLHQATKTVRRALRMVGVTQ
jgi:HEPN domain-containing protein